MVQEEINAVWDVLLCSWIGLRPKRADFERRFAIYVGTGFAPSVNSATAAPGAPLILLGVTHGDEVIVSSARAYGASWKGRYCGSLGDIGRLIFDAMENFTMCDSVVDRE
jgi:dTDP-4-amino-4,6-dideoxygalactose transaminase